MIEKMWAICDMPQFHECRSLHLFMTCATCCTCTLGHAMPPIDELYLLFLRDHVTHASCPL